LKKLLVCILGLSLFISVNSQAVEIIRDGPTVVIKASCLAFNLDTLNAQIPQGITTIPELVGIYLANIRELTPQEVALCNGTEVVIPMWRVAANSGKLTRPVYRLNANGSRSSTKIRADIGSPCENAIPTYSLSSSGGREWRYLAGQTSHVVLCEYK